MNIIMKTDFDWQTEKEQPELSGRPEGFGNTPGNSRRPKQILAVLLILAASILIVWYVLQKRLTTVETAVMDEVLTSHELVMQAAATQDEELFYTLLSGRNADWTQAQVERVERGLFTSPIPVFLGLQTIPEAQEATISLDPQHQEATVQLEQPYTVTDPQGITETIFLQETFVYHRGEQRWLLSPPDSSFWGDQSQFSGTFVTLDYPQRDEELARRLAVDLDAKLQEMCEIPIPTRPGCPNDLHIQLHLSSEPDSLLSLAATNQRFESGIELILPTPTLVGIPTTETAYQALFRIYAARVLSAVITHLTGNHCCIFRTVLEKQLNQLGVFPWPLTTTTDPLSLFRNFAPLRELEPVWLLTPEEELTEAERTLLYAFVDLLVEERGMQPANLLTWRLNLVDLLSSSGESAETLWWNYVYEKGARAQRQVSFTPPYPWPRQNLYLTCRNRENENGLYRYDPAGDQWSKERAFAEGNVVVLPLPDDRGMVISTGQFERETFVLLPNGTEYPVPVDSGNVSLPSDSVSDPLGRYLLLYYTSPTVFRTVYLDINSCDEAGCNLISAEQQPVWSPDGAHVLLWSDALLQRGQSLDGPLTPVSPAGVYSHFWWDNNVPGYVAGLGDRILLVTGRNESPQVWLTADDLASAVPPEMRQGSWKIQEVSPTPDGNSFLVSASRRGQSDYHLFLVRGAGNSAGQGLDELATPVVFYLVSMPLQPRGLQFSPDGQWLAVPIFDREPTNAELFFFFDLRVPEIVLQSQLPFSMESYNLDWSADSRWLARLGDGFLEFTAPATIDMPHQHYVFPGDLSCTSLAWIKS